jgi:hypothetical protein
VNDALYPKTRDDYVRKIDRMRAFARDSISWDEDIFENAPLPDNFVKEFIGKIRSLSVIHSYINALKWWYGTLENVEISQDLEEWLISLSHHEHEIAVFEGYANLELVAEAFGKHSMRVASVSYMSSFDTIIFPDATNQRISLVLGGVRDRYVSNLLE